jgi:hypothetical protein
VAPRAQRKRWGLCVHGELHLARSPVVGIAKGNDLRLLLCVRGTPMHLLHGGGLVLRGTRQNGGMARQGHRRRIPFMRAGRQAAGEDILFAHKAYVEECKMHLPGGTSGDMENPSHVESLNKMTWKVRNPSHVCTRASTPWRSNYTARVDLQTFI